ncbi:hypothetical protein CC86DRAFT_365640 [Ophiobolus disseminans]|uniref:Uncharacterized protein n=1 Tax=Ophiobolus disseminans TaxID=1469910 RepID=A0A6A7AMK2_9PLEO|nr:hypothetical protein CC86DRAFT_365640 [Ophiobolus disseminans]
MCATLIDVEILTSGAEEGKFCIDDLSAYCDFRELRLIQNQQSGTEFARTKEDQAAIMRAKQQAGTCPTPVTHRFTPLSSIN